MHGDWRSKADLKVRLENKSLKEKSGWRYYLVQVPEEEELPPGGGGGAHVTEQVRCIVPEYPVKT